MMLQLSQQNTSKKDIEKKEKKEKSPKFVPKNALITYFDYKRFKLKKKFNIEICYNLQEARRIIKKRYLPDKDNNLIGKFKDMIFLVVYYNSKSQERIIVKNGKFYEKIK